MKQENKQKYILKEKERKRIQKSGDGVGGRGRKGRRDRGGRVTLC